MSIRDAAIWLSGHSPLTLQETPRDQSPIISLIGAVAGGAVVAGATDWAIAAYSLVASIAPRDLAPLIAAPVGAAIGGYYLVSTNRLGGYVLDTKLLGAGRKLALLAVLCGTGSLVSAGTTLSVGPILFSKDGGRVAQDLRAQRATARAIESQQRFGIDALTETVNQASQEYATAKSNAATVPQDILELQRGAKLCAAQLSARRRALATGNQGEAWIRRQLIDLSNRCSSLAATAQRELAKFRETGKQAVTEAERLLAAKRSTLSDAREAMTQELRVEAQADSQNITHTSRFVQDSILQRSWSALLLLASMFLLLQVIEWSPLLLKWIIKPSLPGLRLAADYERAASRLRKETVEAEDDELQSDAIREGIETRLRSALNSPRVADRMSETFDNAIEALTAFDLAKRNIEALEELDERRRSSVARRPGAASAINAFSDAIQSEIVARYRASCRNPQTISEAA